MKYDLECVIESIVSSNTDYGRGISVLDCVRNYVYESIQRPVMGSTLGVLGWEFEWDSIKDYVDEI